MRHGESESNAGGPIGNDVALTAKGLDQARYMAARAAKLPIDVVISSTFPRARQTAEEIAKAVGKTVADTSDLFVERQYPLEQHGMPEHDSEAKRVEQIINTRFGEEGFRHSTEENFEDLKHRALQALAYLDKREEENILLVTHGMFLRMLMAVVVFGDSLTGEEAKAMFYGFKSQNTGLTILENNPDDRMRPGWRIFVWNDHAHLG